MAPGAKTKFGALMFEPEIFRKQIHCIEESTCDIFGTFRRPGNCAPLAPLVTPLATNLERLRNTALEFCRVRLFAHHALERKCSKALKTRQVRKKST